MLSRAEHWQAAMLHQHRGRYELRKTFWEVGRVPLGKFWSKEWLKGTAKGQTFKNHPIQTFLYEEMLAIKYVFA